MKITIDSSITTVTPNFHIGVMTADVRVCVNPELDPVIDELEQDIQKSLGIEDVIHLDVIRDGREAYRAYGKDPSRYRLAAESLYRRLAKGNRLYRINNVVDLGNVLSIVTRKSVAVLDVDRIVGDVVIRLGTEQDAYEGIGRGKLNIDRIPLYEDDLGPFGSTTSDTERTKITENTSKILLFLISFSGIDSLASQLQYASDLYTKYASAKNVSFSIL